MSLLECEDHLGKAFVNLAFVTCRVREMEDRGTGQARFRAAGLLPTSNMKERPGKQTSPTTRYGSPIVKPAPPLKAGMANHFLSAFQVPSGIYLQPDLATK